MTGTPSTDTAAESPVGFRRTRDGQWAVCGPAPLLRAALDDGGVVTVSKRGGGMSHVTICRVAQSFTVDGIEMAYGYLEVANAMDGAA